MRLICEMCGRSGFRSQSGLTQHQMYGTCTRGLEAQPVNPPPMPGRQDVTWREAENVFPHEMDSVVLRISDLFVSEDGPDGMDLGNTYESDDDVDMECGPNDMEYGPNIAL